jgi:folate-binding protein YgfZ
LSQDSSGNDRTSYDALRRGAASIERSDAGRLRLTGADRRDYLQGLLTNDIAALGPGMGCYAAMLTAQGRMMSDMRVLEVGDAILLDVPRPVATQIREHLDRFIFNEDVQVEDVTASSAEIGLYGPAAAGVLESWGATVSDDSPLYSSRRAALAGIDALVVRSDEYGVSGFDVIVDVSAAPHIAVALATAGAVRATNDDLEVVRVESGRPLFGVDMDADTIPLEAGIEDRAVSRTKGCYVGQEVIVRVLDRGHGRVAKRLVGLLPDPAAAAPPRGARIMAGGRDIGHVTSALWSPSLKRPIALGYVHRDFVEPGTTVEIRASGSATVARLPFV